MDPALSLALRVSLGLLLAVAASHKLRDLPRFRAVVANYEVLPRAASERIAPLFALVELALALTLMMGSETAAAGLVAALLFVAYGIAIHLNIRRGRTGIDCGCMGPASHVPLGDGLVLRNGLLAVASLSLMLAPSARPLGWLDAFTVIAATGTMALCWQASERMLRLAPGLARLRRKAS